MSYTIVTLSSVGNSSPVALNWRGGSPTSVFANIGSSTATVDYTIQYTLDDAMLSGSSVQAWINVGSSVGSSATHFSSANFDTGVPVGFAYPIAAVRLNSTAISASTLTLRVLQGESF
jgi:hypothetical protein